MMIIRTERNSFEAVPCGESEMKLIEYDHQGRVMIRIKNFDYNNVAQVILSPSQVKEVVRYLERATHD